MLKLEPSLNQNRSKLAWVSNVSWALLTRQPPQVVHNFSLSNMFMQQDRHIIRNNIAVPRIVICSKYELDYKKARICICKRKIAQCRGNDELMLRRLQSLPMASHFSLAIRPENDDISLHTCDLPRVSMHWQPPDCQVPTHLSLPWTF